MCLEALSVEDSEDIYQFGTMITGILLIGLGFTLGYRKIQKTGTAVQSLTRLPVMMKLWEERSALRLRLLTETWILSRRSSRLCKRKLMLSDIRMDRENSCEGMQLLAPKTKQINLIFSGSPVPAPASAKVVLDNVENSVLLKCRKLRREDQETSDSIVSRISLFYDMCCYLQSSKISS